MKLSHTALTHPSMIAKIRRGMKLAALGKGEEMNGHGNRVYVQNKHGNNIMRIQWLKGEKRFIVWGDQSCDVTADVKKALQLAQR